jgi:hypothetical protein
MVFVDNPIITSPFDAPAFHYELDNEGQPTGAKRKDRRESIQIVPVPAARRRGARGPELDLFGPDGSKITPSALCHWRERWGFLELKDAPYDAASLIREFIHPLLAAE